MLSGRALALAVLGWSLLKVASARIFGKLVGRKTSDDRLPPKPLNDLLRGIFGLERHLVGRVPLPAGVSLFALLAPASIR